MNRTTALLPALAAVTAPKLGKTYELQSQSADQKIITYSCK